MVCRLLFLSNSTNYDISNTLWKQLALPPNIHYCRDVFEMNVHLQCVLFKPTPYGNKYIYGSFHDHGRYICTNMTREKSLKKIQKIKYNFLLLFLWQIRKSCMFSWKISNWTLFLKIISKLMELSWTLQLKKPCSQMQNFNPKFPWILKG